ncbi:MAG: hypothetical protein WDW38_011233 [Sanguina aurantia]
MQSVPCKLSCGRTPPLRPQFLFAACDVLAATLVNKLLLLQHISPGKRRAAVLAALFNPWTAAISTRGSCDVVAVVLILSTLLLLLQRRNLYAALLFGLAVHLRIYPIIYAPSVVMFLIAAQYRQQERQHKSVQQPQQEHTVSPQRQQQQSQAKTTTCPTLAASGSHDLREGHPKREAEAVCEQRRRHPQSGLRVARTAVVFGLVSGGVFLSLGCACYSLYGQLFLQEAFLHHVTRQDPRHNFSPHFYPTYLAMLQPPASQDRQHTHIDARSRRASADSSRTTHSNKEAGEGGGMHSGAEWCDGSDIAQLQAGQRTCPQSDLDGLERGSDAKHDSVRVSRGELGDQPQQPQPQPQQHPSVDRQQDSLSASAGSDHPGAPDPQLRDTSEQHGSSVRAPTQRGDPVGGPAPTAVGHPAPAAVGGPAHTAVGDPAPAAVGGPAHTAVGHPAPAAVGGPAHTAVGHPAPAAVGGPAPAAVGHPAPAAVGELGGGSRQGQAWVPDTGRVVSLCQAALVLAASWRCHADLPACWTIVTILFVSFNKVVTAQYFAWYFSLLPLLLPHIAWPVPRGLGFALAGWASAQVHWLVWAYALEFQGIPVYLLLWAASILFLVANTMLVQQIVASVKPAHSFLHFATT